jgi:hypothetical protein
MLKWLLYLAGVAFAFFWIAGNLSELHGDLKSVFWWMFP